MVRRNEDEIGLSGQERMMSLLVWTYLLYLVATFYVTVIVGQHLHHFGRPFLLVCLAGRTALADAVNHLLLVGYYLTNFALAAFQLQSGLTPVVPLEVLELLSQKLGLVLIILGAMHAVNMVVLRMIWWRLRALSAVAVPVR